MRMNMKGPLSGLPVTWIDNSHANTPALFRCFFFWLWFRLLLHQLIALFYYFKRASVNCAGYLAENFRLWLPSIPSCNQTSARCLGNEQFWQLYIVFVHSSGSFTALSFTPITNQMVWAGY